MVKLEVGKFYKTRSGEKVGPLMKNVSARYPFWVEGCTWTEGGYIIGPDRLSHSDIVDEWPAAFDPTLPFRCANGWEAKIYDVELRHGAIKNEKGRWLCWSWNENWECHYKTGTCNLVNIPEEKSWPQVGDKYYFVHANGDISKYSWDDGKVDKNLGSMGNIFPFEEEAQRHVRIQRTRAKIRKILDTQRPQSEAPHNGMKNSFLCIVKVGDNPTRLTFYNCQGSVVSNEWKVTDPTIIDKISDEIPISDLREVFGL